jgi:hypothetical protein
MKIKQTLIALALLIGVGVLLFTPIVSAETCNQGQPNEYETSIIPCSTDGQGGVLGILLLIIDILTAGIGIAAVGGIIYGAILYTTASGSMEQTKQAKTIIFNVVIGLVAYALMYSFMNYIIPGGIF